MDAITKIQQAGFELWIKDNGNIGIQPFNLLTPEQLAFLKRHKSEILEQLSQQQAANDVNLDNQLSKVRSWLHSIGETDQAMIDDVLDYCGSNQDALAYYLERAEEVPPPDDRYHCRECLNLRNGYCIKQRFRPVDDLPRRCENFNIDRSYHHATL
jgi:hypothetical protein